MKCLVEILASVAIRSQGRLLFAAMLFKRENFNRNYDKVPPVKYCKNFTHRTQCYEQTNSCGSDCRLRHGSPVTAGNVWSLQLTLPW